MTGPTVAAPVEQLEVKGSLGLLRLLTAARLFCTEQFMMRCKPAFLACKPTRLSLRRKGFKQWPLAPDSQYELEALTLDKMVTLFYGGSRMDRHVRHLDHLFLADGSWVQGQMLKRGMARVYTFPDNRTIAIDMYALERQACNANMGFWAHPFYSLKAAAPNVLLRLFGTFQLIKGRVLNEAKVKGTIYLNFGENWRDDFTITLKTKTRRALIKSNLHTEMLEFRYIQHVITSPAV